MFIELHVDHCVVKDKATETPLLKGTISDVLYLLRQSNNPKAFLGQKVSMYMWC